MRIEIFEPELITRRGFNGFYNHFLAALVSHGGAVTTHESRPLPRLVKPREHESAWIRWDGHLVLFDMSDHVHLFDLEALRRADVYFKANLHRGIARRVLKAAGLAGHEAKLAPFLFFAEGLDRFKADRLLRRLTLRNRPRLDLCHVVGVYANAVADGEPSPYEDPSVPMTPAACHFWIRWHTQQALIDAGISGTYRLTSRANRRLEDGRTVHPNLSRRAFSRHITDGRLTVVNTFPHALLPWKASESLVLGRPLLLEQSPLTECPAPFALRPGEHFLEFLPGAGAFSETAPLEEAASHRVLARIPPARFHERAAWLRGQLQDRDRFGEMGAACLRHAAMAYGAGTVYDYIREQVTGRIH